MTTKKMTAAEVEKTLLPKLQGFKEEAARVKDAHAKARQAIKDNPRLSPEAKKDDLAALVKDTRAKLDCRRRVNTDPPGVGES